MGGVKVAFLWHQHQPYYKDLVTGSYILPWARLHGVKDYYNMVDILQGFPKIRQTINLVPSLIEQLEGYSKGEESKDIYLELTLTPASDLTDEGKSFILKNFFSANRENMIKVHPRYEELLARRGYHLLPHDLKDVRRKFKAQDLLDLQVWFNLAWFDPASLKRDLELAEIAGKERNFSEEDKLTVVKKQREVISKVIDKHRELFLKGQIDITTTPFYHPILPLLCDTDIAKVSLPSTGLPKIRFSHPEDARVQIDRAIGLYREYFGTSPKGMWPAEGSVSNEAAALFAEAGVKWIATDEDILSRSLRQPLKRDGDGGLSDPDILYRPYLLRVGGREIMVIFRDHLLSDLIGFTYSGWSPADAARDMVRRLVGLGRRSSGNEYLVSIILDGENAWEFYRNNGRDFLEALYQMISDEESLEALTVSEFLEGYKNPAVLDGIFPGSWIDHNFRIWIGHPEDNLAWDYLGRTRQALVDFGKGHKEDPRCEERLAKAWEEIYIAEGSDWFWWYGDDHSSAHDAVFDELFRKHLMNVYEIIGLDVPGYLWGPIISDRLGSDPTSEPVSLIKPTIDGRVTTYYEWGSAGSYSTDRSGGAMHRAESMIKGIFYGFDYDHLYVRIDPSVDLKDESMAGLSVVLHTIEPRRSKIDMPISPDGQVRHPYLYLRPAADEPMGLQASGVYCVDRVVEIKMPFSELAASPGDRMLFFVSIIRQDGMEIEKFPKRSPITVLVPTLDFESALWSV